MANHKPSTIRTVETHGAFILSIVKEWEGQYNVCVYRAGKVFALDPKSTPQLAPVAHLFDMGAYGNVNSEGLEAIRNALKGA